MTTNPEPRYGGHTIAELAAMEQQAMPRPWEERRGKYASHIASAITNIVTTLGMKRSDAMCIIAARNALPDLLAEIQRLQEERTVLIGALHDIANARHYYEASDLCDACDKWQRSVVKGGRLTVCVQCYARGALAGREA